MFNSGVCLMSDEGKDYISGCVNFSFNCQFVSLLQAYLLLELSSSSLLAGTGGNQQRPAATGPLIFSVNHVLWICFLNILFTPVDLCRELLILVLSCDHFASSSLIFYSVKSKNIFSIISCKYFSVSLLNKNSLSI